MTLPREAFGVRPACSAPYTGSFGTGGRPSSVRSAMFIVIVPTRPGQAPFRSAMFIIIVPTRPGQAPQERHEWDWRHRPGRLEHMPLLRSLAELVAGATISMALLAELFASPWPRQQRARDPCKVQQLAGAFHRCRAPESGSQLRALQTLRAVRGGGGQRGSVGSVLRPKSSRPASNLPDGTTLPTGSALTRVLPRGQPRP